MAIHGVGIFLLIPDIGTFVEIQTLSHVRIMAINDAS